MSNPDFLPPPADAVPDDHLLLIDDLRRRLAEPLPGHAAHAQMAPFPRRADPSVISVDGKGGRPAATLVLLYPGRTGATSFVLTVRQPSLRTHSGQVSLPGGSLDPGETPEAAARREAWEEVGVPPDLPDVLGRLTPLYIPPSGFSVWPVVAALRAMPTFAPQEREVSGLINVSLRDLLDPAARRKGLRVLGSGPPATVPFFALDGHEVWGATAMMLAEFAAVLNR